MLIAYLTTDEVNQDLARSLAEAHGITVYPVSPREALPGLCEAVLYDWDYWPAGRREEALGELLAGPAPCPVALHGYNVDPEWAEVLRRRGVAVHRTLRVEVFESLRRAVLAVRDAAGRGRARDDVLAATGRVESAGRT